MNTTITGRRWSIRMTIVMMAKAEHRRSSVVGMDIERGVVVMLMRCAHIRRYISLSIVFVFLSSQKRIWRQVEARALRLLSRVFFVFLDSFILYCRNPYIIITRFFPDRLTCVLRDLFPDRGSNYYGILVW